MNRHAVGYEEPEIILEIEFLYMTCVWKLVLGETTLLWIIFPCYYCNSYTIPTSLCLFGIVNLWPSGDFWSGKICFNRQGKMPMHSSKNKEKRRLFTKKWFQKTGFRQPEARYSSSILVLKYLQNLKVTTLIIFFVHNHPVIFCDLFLYIYRNLIPFEYFLFIALADLQTR